MKFSACILNFLLLAASWAQADDTFRLAFGSCNGHNRPQPLWEPILQHKPDVWVWLGDIVYTDTYDMEVLRSAYAHQKMNPGYANLWKSTKVVGIWDDHEYGVNDSGAEYPMKKESQKELLDFLDEPEASPRRQQEGIYASYDFGEGDRRLKLILLDGRYHREEPGPKSDMLGEAQWEWLEHELRTSEAKIHVIGSSIQVIPTEQRFEKWAAFPAARQRLIKLIADS
ncbi:MAG: alkaline phosphatase family protein, partial [Bryobacteraceae bacterium]|nr:alkaline phosphatase family protein [Bryobacteraceae bacterium]